MGLKLAAIERALSIDGLKMADTSFFVYDDHFRPGNLFLKEVDVTQSKEIVRCHNDFYTSVQTMVDKSSGLIFPTEFLLEYRLLSSTMRDKYMQMMNLVGRNPNWPQREVVKSKASDLKNLMNLRREYLASITREREAERHISPMAYGFLPAIERAFLEIDQIHQFRAVSRGYRKVDRPYGLEKNRDNDAKIAAKAFAISYDSDLKLLTCDMDHIWLFDIFYNDPNFFADKYQFPLPENVVDVVFHHENLLKKVSAGSRVKDAQVIYLGDEASK
jgi:hypothetical protein